jgi:RNA polymerase sigma-70 factor (ECF subfamily)
MNEVNSPTDEELVQEIQAGAAEAFGVLVERYEGKMKRYAHRFLFGYDDAEDLVQEVFVKAYINIQSFDAERKFSSWLYRIAHNEFINAIKKKKREPLPFFDPDNLFPHPLAPEQADSELNRKEVAQMLETCLDKLNVKYREILVLYYFEDMDYREIAEVLKIPVATVGVRLKRGRDIMRSLIEKM